MGLLGKVMRKRRLTRRMPESSRFSSSVSVTFFTITIMPKIEMIIMTTAMIMKIRTQHVAEKKNK